MVSELNLTPATHAFTLDLIEDAKRACIEALATKQSNLLFLTPSEYADPRIRANFPGYDLREIKPLPLKMT
jgi:hypothetical protein